MARDFYRLGIEVVLLPNDVTKINREIALKAALKTP